MTKEALREAIAHALAEGSWSYECTSVPEPYHYIMADRVLKKLAGLAALGL